MIKHTKLLTFESWVSRAEWYDYATRNASLVPRLLLDRSPCQDPFFDPFAADPDTRRVLISGLCRGIKHFTVGQRFIYITRIDNRLSQRLGISRGQSGPCYFGVAALEVVRVWPSHEEAAKDFEPRRYIVAPLQTPYPPNLAFDKEPKAAVGRESSISYQGKLAHYPPNVTSEIWQGQYTGYLERQKGKGLRVAECRTETIDGYEALQLDITRAPVLTPATWDSRKMNVMGLWINESQAQSLRQRIALSHLPQEQTL